MFSQGLIHSCVFRNNRASHGGAVCVAYANKKEHVLFVENCSFQQNVAQSAGGALFARDMSLTLTNSTLSGNTAETGSVVYHSGIINSVLMSHCTIRDNKGNIQLPSRSQEAGSAVTVTNSDHVLIGNSTISNNDGSALLLINTRGQIISSSFVKNGGFFGGGIATRGCSSWLEVTNTSFIKNSGVALNLQSCKTFIQNCTFLTNNDSETQHTVVISAEKKMDIRIWNSTFIQPNLMLSHQFSIIELRHQMFTDVIPATIYAWNMSILWQRNETLQFDRSISKRMPISKVVSVLSVNRKQKFSPFASGKGQTRKFSQ